MAFNDFYFFLLNLIIIFCVLLSMIIFYFKKSYSLSFLWVGFRRKIWMTIGLGSIFFLLYLTVVFSLIKFKQAYLDHDLFLTIYQAPLEAIYIGLWLFACSSLCIYFVRLIIKYVFLTKGKDF